MRTCRVILLAGVWVTAVLAAPGTVAAQAGRAQVQEGNRLYGEGLYNEAHEQYLEALREAPGSPLIRFNEGNALYQGGEVERALEAYRAAIESGNPELQSAAWYNLGNALYQAQQLEESLEAYKESLRADPRDVDAKHNLERVLEQMQEQEDQDQQDGENEDQDQEQDQQDQQNENEEDQQNQGQDQDQQNPDPSDDEQEGEGEPERREGEMSQEEAERLLQAVQEDPDEVNRKGQPARGRKPRKKW